MYARPFTAPTNSPLGRRLLIIHRDSKMLCCFTTLYSDEQIYIVHLLLGREGPLEGRRHRHEKSPEESRAEDGRSPARDGRGRGRVFRGRRRENPPRLSPSSDSAAPESSSSAPDPHSAQRHGFQRQPHFSGHPNPQGLFCTFVGDFTIYFPQSVIKEIFLIRPKQLPPTFPPKFSD